MIRAILRAQLLSMRWGRGAVFSVITAALWYGAWCVVAAGVFSLCATAPLGRLQALLPTGFLLALVYWQIVPMLSASFGTSLDMHKLMVYPVPHRKLFLVEVLLRFTTGIEVVLVAIAALAGLLTNRFIGWSAAPRIILTILLFLAFNLLLASGLRSLWERMLSRPIVRELLVLAIFFVVYGVGPRYFGGLGSLAVVPASPWTVAANAVLGGRELAALGTLLAWTLAAGWFGRRQFERNLRYDALAAQASRESSWGARAAWTEEFYRLPSRVLPDPLAALVEKELRSLARTPRFRVLFVMGFAFAVMIWLPLIQGTGGSEHGFLERNFLTVVSVYALTLLGQVTYWNCFGFDRSAAVLYFAAPQPLRTVFLGKNLASLIFIYAEVAILSVVTLALRVASPGSVVEAVLVVAVCALYMLAFGNIASVQYPRALTPQRVSQGGASSRFQALVFFFYPIALAPVILAYLGGYAFSSRLAFELILALAAALGAALYWMALDSAVNTANRRRERILHDLGAGEGPMVSE